MRATLHDRWLLVRLGTAAVLYWLAVLISGIQQQSPLVPLMVAVGLPVVAWCAARFWHAGRVNEHLAYSDDLTGLANRRAFRRKAEAAIERARPGSLALILLDVDDLKTINDRCGHLAGDELLTTVSRSLRKALPASDSIYRVGGDEFAILVDRTKGESVTTVVESLQPFTTRLKACGHDHVIAASYGCASAREGDSLDELFERADLRLRDYKRLLYESGKLQDRRRQYSPASSTLPAVHTADTEQDIASNVASFEERRRRRVEVGHS